MKSKIKKIIILLILILSVLSISEFINNSVNQTRNSNQVSGHFENQYIEFDLPEGVTVQDISNNKTFFDVILYKNGVDFGEIDNEITPPQAINALDGSNITFADKKAIESNDEFGSYLYIIIKNDTQGNTIGIRIELDPGYSKDYEVIKNSFVIKNTP